MGDVGNYTHGIQMEMSKEFIHPDFNRPALITKENTIIGLITLKRQERETEIQIDRDRILHRNPTNTITKRKNKSDHRKLSLIMKQR